ncbi:MAG: hypothetical protein IK118_05800 [Clostridia bacterium]|nr:hypothetical protein [Clostridia bacterium]
MKFAAFFLALQMFFASLFGAGGMNFDRASAIAKNDLAAAGYSLSRTMQRECYDILRHTLHSKTDSTEVTYIWGAASYLEMLSDAYRLFPGDVTLRANYRDALKQMLPRYLAADQTIETADGAVDGISYYNASRGNTGDYYYDDNEWVCIQLLIGYENLGDPALLRAAEENLKFLWTGWDDVAGGGIYWYMDHTSKNACSNAPAAIAYLLGYQITGEEIYLERGKMIYDWMNRSMREEDLFADAVSLDGTVANHWKGIYNQATMIYAGTLLYEITGEEEYYTLTKATVDATIRHLFSETQDESGETVICMQANPIYTAWCVGWIARAYVKFYEADPQKDTAAMEHFIAVMTAELATKDENGLYDPFFLSGAANPEAYTGLLAQCGVACSLLNAAYYDALLR